MVKALILYEDLETGLRAKDSLDRLSRQLERDESLSTELYRLDLLREPLGREMVAIEAAARDIAILSLHGKDGLPHVVYDWMERWLKHKEARPYALAILLDPEVAYEGAVTAVINVMGRIGALGGVYVYCGSNGINTFITSAANSFRNNPKETANHSLYVFQEFQQPIESSLGCGINE